MSLFAVKHVRSFLDEVQTRVARCDPAGGRWDVSGEKADVWVDASSIAIGVVLTVDGEVVEDASWLRSTEVTHINMAELDAVVKGLKHGTHVGVHRADPSHRLCNRPSVGD